MARILVVDDDPALANAVERGLRIAGHEVTVSLRGSEALALFKAGMRFDLVVSDFEMPGMTGGELCIAVQNLVPTPFIIQSGNEDVLEFAASCGASRVLRKPVPTTEFREAVEELLVVDREGASA
jgi:CheY-like chemotaxis protein